MKEYNFKIIEKKWQDKWAETNAFAASDKSDKPKFYNLVEFPYPSGAGLHVGHIRAYTPLEVISRKRRLEGYNVLFPMGWDAFGLPTENYAIKTGIHPRKVTDTNVEIFKNQLNSVGYSFDWSREIDTTKEDYVKWTQWIFLKLYEKGLAYKENAFVNYCPNCKVVLSNEESQGGKCDRCDSEVIQKEKEVWTLKITDYADKLIDDMEGLDFIPRVKTSQENWIGRSNGAEVEFSITNTDEKLKVFTTRPDTLFGVTFMVIAPEHPMLAKYKGIIENYSEVESYKMAAQKKSEFERVELAKDKTGVEIKGLKAINPITGAEIPVWISDYVMMGYGTGAIMAVPAHDSRDFDFAKKFGIDIKQVISEDGSESELTEALSGNGVMINSDFLNGMEAKVAKEEMIKYVTEKQIGTRKTNYKMKDWTFARQRYWGEPVPIIYCDHCGTVEVPEADLPVRLPVIENFKPGQNGESPLADVSEWVNVKCPVCGRDARRETDTMPQWAGSSWYFLRYIDPTNEDMFAEMEKLKYWLPVDWYSGGMEHVTRHLIYSRFWHKFLYDEGFVPTKEPYNKRTAHGLVLGPDGEKMSKSRGNVINPNDIVNEYGADTLRTYMMFMGDYEKAVVWSDNALKGCKRFLDRVWKLQEITADETGYSKELESSMHKTIKGVSQDIENLKFNTAIAKMMSLINEFYEKGSVTRDEVKTLLVLLNPTAPHITEEMWSELGFGGMITETTWPTYDESKMVSDTMEVPVQVNGKLKAKVEVAADASEEEVMIKAKESVLEFTEGKQIVKEIYINKKIANIVVK